MPKEEEVVSRREADILWQSHRREHEAHDHAHQVEHVMTSEALTKADAALDKRLEGMNEFRAQLDRQTVTFLTRDMFEAYVKEQITKTELALSTSADKYDTIIKAIVNRHESDIDSVRDEMVTLKDTHNRELSATKESLGIEIQGEREYRKTLEASINVWKFIASFLGASGVAGVVLLFATRSP